MGASSPSDHLLLDGVCVDSDWQRQPDEMDDLLALPGTLRTKQTKAGTSVVRQ